MKTKHTPGAWLAVHKAKAVPGSGWTVWPEEGSGHARICSVVDGDDAEANARLIAAYLMRFDVDKYTPEP